MRSAGILLVFLSQQGHWLAGHQSVITVRHRQAEDRRPMILAWVLGYNDVRVASGRVKVEPNKLATVHMTVPEVRVRTPMQLAYRVQEANDRRLLESGTEAVTVYPDNLLSGLTTRLKDRRLVVWDRADRIPALLEKAEVDHSPIDDESQLTLQRPDIIVVGPGQIEDRPFGQNNLVGQANAGARVFLFAQTRVTRLADYPLGLRRDIANLVWRSEHRLVRRIHQRRFDRESVAAKPLRLPANDSAQCLAFWPRGDAGDQFVDVLVAVKNVGKGQFVFCQLPLGDLKSDPRSQLFLADVLDYLAAKWESD